MIREVNVYDYVDRPLELVRLELARNATGVFTRATSSAVAHLAALRIGAGAFEVGVQISIDAIDLADISDHVTRMSFTWRAARRASLFPTMHATLSLVQIAADCTKLELSGAYDPPFGVAGKTLDALVMHRVAEACALHFLRDVASLLRADLPREPGAGATYPI